MSSAMSIASGGLHAAVRQFEQAARDIVATGTLTSDPAGPEGNAPSERAGPAGTAASGTGAPPRVSGLSLGNSDFISPIIDMQQAETSYKAMIKVIQAADRLERAAIDMVR